MIEGLMFWLIYVGGMLFFADYARRLGYRRGYDKGFKIGVLQGTVLGRYPDQKQRSFDDAQRIVDAADAVVAWEMALSEERS